MARAARPINPDEGPVQAFAFELRALREAAGNPTYRALAKTAGFSATTLGDAAGGAKLPSLDVTLAYVGACDGDVAAWRERWQSVNRALAVQGVAEVTDVEEVEDVEEVTEVTEVTDVEEVAEVEEVEEPVVVAPVAEVAVAGRRSRGAVAWIGVAALSAAAVVVAMMLWRNGSAHAAPTAAPSTAASSCPAAPPGSGGFVGETYGDGANIRSAASLSAPVRERVPSGCTIHFSGFCLGDVVKDDIAGTPDIRWFIVPDRGEVASAVVHGNPPLGMRPQPCPGSVPSPSSIALSVSAADSGGGVVALAATGKDLWIVGFAAYYGTGPGGGDPQWHQLAMGGSAADGSFTALLRPGLATSPPTPAGIPVAAVACLGGDGATGVAVLDLVPAGPAGALTPYQPGAASLAAAEQTACRYPTAA